MGMIPGFDLYSNKERWKMLLLVFAIAIGMGSVWYTNILVKDLSKEEEKKLNYGLRLLDMCLKQKRRLLT